MFWLYRWGTWELPNNAVRDDISPGTGRSAFIQLPAGGRIDQFGSGRLPIDASSLSKQIWVGESDFNRLRNEVGKREKLYRRWDSDERLEFTEARLTNMNVVREIRDHRNRCYIETSLNFEVIDPKWESLSGIAWTLDSGETLDSGLFLDAGATIYTAINTNSFTFNVDASSSGIEVRNMKFSLIANGGTINSPKITNNSNKMFMQARILVSDGEELIFDVPKREVTLNGVSVYKNFFIGPNQIEWFQFEPDVNEILVEAVPTNEYDLKVIWTGVYL